MRMVRQQQLTALPVSFPAPRLHTTAHLRALLSRKHHPVKYNAFLLYVMVVLVKPQSRKSSSCVERGVLLQPLQPAHTRTSSIMARKTTSSSSFCAGPVVLGLCANASPYAEQTLAFVSQRGRERCGFTAPPNRQS